MPIPNGFSLLGRVTSARPGVGTDTDRLSPPTGLVSRVVVATRLRSRDRLAARQQDAVHHPALALVVVDREVPGLPVVPHRDRAGGPAEAGRELRPHAEVERILPKGS